MHQFIVLKHHEVMEWRRGTFVVGERETEMTDEEKNGRKGRRERIRYMERETKRQDHETEGQ